MGIFQRVALGVTKWTERWFPDAFIFTALAVIAVAAGALLIGAAPKTIAVSFGTGFWSLITFTMQMAIIGFCRKVWYLGQNGKTDRNYFKNLQHQKLTKNKLCDRTRIRSFALLLFK